MKHQKTMHAKLEWKMGRFCCGLLLASLANSAFGDNLLSIKIENDLFSAGGDRHYTNGFDVTYAFEPADDHWTRRLGELIPGWSTNNLVGVTYRFGQQMYTPEDIETEALVEDDRPYAGLLFGGVSLFNHSQHEGWRLAESLHLDAGIVGPASGAGALQKNYHEWIGADDPKGWHNQLANEPIIGIAYERAWVMQEHLAELDIEYGPTAGFALGNLYTYASSGLGLRLGKGLDRSFGIPSVAPAQSGRSSFRRDHGFTWYLFTALEGRYMAHNLLLDGNTFEDSHSVERREWVADFQAGLALTWDRWQLTYTYLLRSEEFEEQDDLDHFGSLMLSFWF